MDIDYKLNTLNLDNTMSDAIHLLQKRPIKIVVVTSNEKLVGTITDGDIRRALLKSYTLIAPCSDIMNKNPHYALENDYMSIKSLLQNYNVIPIVDNEHTLVNIISSNIPDKKERLPNSVVIMAGGEGKRLQPLTFTTPKPLLPLKKKPIIHKIIDRLSKYGLYDINISVHYKAQMLKDYFTNQKILNVNVNFLEESTPLGTAGCLYLLKNKKITDPIIIINGDILTEINYIDLINYHKKVKNVITICAAFYETQIPFGTLEVENNKISKITEKPIQKHLINAGIYIIDDSVLNSVKENTYLNMPDLINMYINKNQVGIYPLHEEWIDIGSHEDYEKAKK